MLGKLDLVLIAAMVGAAAFTYRVKHHAEEQVAAINHLQREIRLEHDTIDLLNADWSVLTQPSRLQQLDEAFDAELNLKTIEPTQIATLNDLPDYPVPDNPPLPMAAPGRPDVADGGGDAVADLLKSVDPVKTGSVIH
ncbi:cell division protein FtsL [Pararhizobium mangrovi]|uniref:Cell division protein FtsL n=1 Tax=Pararhizobium mangrovi TaxID=2590452 RepID=A0A506U4I4_9HYPH|nr:hypothetical protein [Pararhizobium mangrovi]TPW29283.1 hypothetical protein FJU11_07680 [Pararhizobium mangrovi]